MKLRFYRRADYLSRNIDPHDYELQHRAFRAMLSHLWVQPTLDLFANRRNSNAGNFVHVGIGTRLVGEAFSSPWKVEVVWLSPPWELAMKAFRKACEERAPTAFYLPAVDGATWWPLLLETADVIHDYAKKR